MKSRRVTLTLEVKTDAPLNILRKREVYRNIDVGLEMQYGVDVLQVQANVIKSLKGGKKTP